jgi:hypothetical protein
MDKATLISSLPDLSHPGVRHEASKTLLLEKQVVLGDGQVYCDLSSLLYTVFAVPMMENESCRRVIVENKSGRLIFAGWCRRNGGCRCLDQGRLSPVWIRIIFLTYWSYCLSEKSLKTALAQQSVKNLLTQLSTKPNYLEIFVISKFSNDTSETLSLLES